MKRDCVGIGTLFLLIPLVEVALTCAISQLSLLREANIESQAVTVMRMVFWAQLILVSIMTLSLASSTLRGEMTKAASMWYVSIVCVVPFCLSLPFFSFVIFPLLSNIGTVFSILNASCCSTLVYTWIMICLRIAATKLKTHKFRIMIRSSTAGSTFVHFIVAYFDRIFVTVLVPWSSGSSSWLPVLIASLTNLALRVFLRYEQRHADRMVLQCLSSVVANEWQNWFQSLIEEENDNKTKEEEDSIQREKKRRAIVRRKIRLRKLLISEIHAHMFHSFFVPCCIVGPIAWHTMNETNGDSKRQVIICTLLVTFLLVCLEILGSIFTIRHENVTSRFVKIVLKSNISWIYPIILLFAIPVYVQMTLWYLSRCVLDLHHE